MDPYNLISLNYSINRFNDILIKLDQFDQTPVSLRLILKIDFIESL